MFDAAKWKSRRRENAERTYLGAVGGRYVVTLVVAVVTAIQTFHTRFNQTQ